MRILGIETSCDETAAAVVENGRVLSNVVSSQIRLHRQYRGIVPELASRAHLQKIAPVIEAALGGVSRLDAVAYTQGPGLMGPLLVGKVAAQALAQLMGLPLVGINHLEGHVFAVELSEALEFPLMALIVSGGHTDLVLCRAPGRYRVLGRTRDDAAGEAFDKVARLLGLGYPGGPHIDHRARKGDPEAVSFPRPHMPETWDFSFAGLKTSVLYYLQKNGQKRVADVCASFQAAVVDTLVAKALRAARKFKVRQIVLGGGVAANSALRAEMATRGAAEGFQVLIPPPDLCTDNGAMIAQAAWHRLKAGRISRRLACDPSLGFQNWAR
ncbi:MAG: tRNA (adenosine(37)-N6)-threonylcarbamoyltransferase complex transferase subunit TsaD [Elusimicrobia bacterium]|nr:tRNA (adenosine(37)-N6)-threonylcarbamoyltransferase complex transferase subunit TsaD [Elusimicrobiota bacterium]